MESLAKIYGVTLNDLLDEDATKIMVVESASKDTTDIDDMFLECMSKILLIENDIVRVKSYDKTYELDSFQYCCDHHNNEEKILLYLPLKNE